MKKYAILSLLTALLLWGCHPQPRDLLPGIEKQMNSHRTIHYKVTEKAKYSWSPDTIVTPYEVWAVREESDTLRHGYVWVNNYYRPYNMIYDQGNFYLAIPPKKTTILYPHFTQPFISDVDWIDLFLDPGRLQQLAATPGVTVTANDTTVNGKKYIALRIRKKEGQVSSDQLYLLDPETYAPLYARLEGKSKDQTFSDELFFSDHTFDQTDVQQLRKKQKQVLADNPVEQESGNSEAARLEKMLHTGEKAPLFTGKFYGSGDPFALKDYIGKYVIILDFWYTHCPPCVRAVPALSELYREKKDEGLKIFGLNSVDNQPRSLPNLKRFLEKRNVSYDIILTQPQVDRQYKINGYPSMYIIDKQGKIARVEIGFSEEKFADLKMKLEELLK